MKERGLIGDEVRASHLQQHPFQLQQHIEEQKMGSFDVSGGTVTSSFEHSNLNDRERKGIPSGQPMGWDVFMTTLSISCHIFDLEGGSILQKGLPKEEIIDERTYDDLKHGLFC